MLARVLIVLVLLVPNAARGDTISAVEKQRLLLDAHRARLETLLGEQTKRISRLKSLPAGIQRDYQLGAALRENQVLADRLTKLRGQLRDLTQKLIVLHNEALSRPGLSTEDRIRLQRRRGELASVLAAGNTRIATGGKASPLDTPDDLEEKADLLQDSEEKVRRQLRQVQTKIAHLEQRARLERHAKAADDNPFMEESPRRSGGAHKVPGAAVASAGGSSNSSSADGSGSSGSSGGLGGAATPAPAAITGKANSEDSSFAGATGRTAEPLPSGSGTYRTPDSTIISIREVLDPSLLRDSQGSETLESARNRIAALKKASEKLRQVAGELAAQANNLRRRAKSLRTSQD